MSSDQGRLFVISGPSGSGKSSICREVAERTGASCSISATTRKPRGNERDGEDYLFLSRQEFEKRIAAGRFYEHATVYDELYGTPREPIERGMAEGKTFLLDIDVHGAESVKRACTRAVLIFILPPDIEELRKRLEDRGTESDEALRLRMSRAEAEMARREEFGYTVVNRELGKTVEEIVGIVKSEKTHE